MVPVRVSERPLKAFNICLVQPEGYVHSHAFDELAELLCFAIRDLGLACDICANSVDDGRQNIVIGCHLLSDTGWLPPSTILLNTEPLFSGENLAWSGRVLEYGRSFAVWDYNAKNVDLLQTLGLSSVSLLPIGYQRELARLVKPPQQETDVLFYGSINDRRQAVLEELRRRGLSVKSLFGVYGAERDAEIARAKVVLNMHFYDQHIFEIVRVFYLMTNAKAVVAEVNEKTTADSRILEGVRAVPYAGLADACARLVADESTRRDLETAALRTIQRFPQAELLAPLIGL